MAPALRDAYTLPGLRMLLAQLGPSWYQTVVLARRLQKGSMSMRKQPERGPGGQIPGPPWERQEVRRGYLRELPSAIQQPEEERHVCHHLQAAMRARRWEAIPGPGGGQAAEGPRSCSAPGCSCHQLFLCRRRHPLHACGQAQPASVSHASVLYLWFQSPGSWAW